MIMGDWLLRYIEKQMSFGHKRHDGLAKEPNRRRGRPRGRWGAFGSMQEAALHERQWREQSREPC